MNSISDKLGVRILILIGFVYVSLFMGLGEAPLFDEDEGWYSLCALEMIQTGDWATPRTGGKPFFHKPPLFYWAQAISFKLLGVNELAARLPSALAAAIWTGAVFLFGLRYSDRRRAFWAAIMMVAALQMTVTLKAAIHDSFFHLFICLSLMAAYANYKRPDLKTILAAQACLGAAVMVKGPTAVIIVVAVSFLFYAGKRSLRAWFKGVFHPLGLLVFFLVAAPWHIAMALEHGRMFWDVYIVEHHFGRFGQAMAHHAEPFWFFIPILPLGIVPFTAPLIRALKAPRKLIENDLLLFCSLWMGFVFVFFSISPAKLPHYLLAGYPGLFLLLAGVIDEDKGDRWILWPAAALSGLVLLALPLLGMIAAFLPDPVAAGQVRLMAASVRPIHYLLALIVLAVQALALYGRNFSGGVRILASVGALLLSANFVVFYLAGAGIQAPLKEAAALTKKLDKPVVAWGVTAPSYMFYLGHYVPKALPKNGELLLTKADRRYRLRGGKIVYDKGGVILIDSTGLNILPEKKD